MNTRLLVAVAALFVVVGLLFYRSSLQDTPPSAPAPATERASGEPRSVTPSEKVARPAAKPESEGVAEPALSLATVVVRVTKSAIGDPVEDVEVRVDVYQGRERDIITEWTGEDGLARFRFPAGSTLWAVKVGPGAETTVASLFPRWALQAGESYDLPIRVGVGGVLRGRVVDDDGEAVPRAVVSCWMFGHQKTPPEIEVIADQHGEFELEHLGGQFVITARNETLACKRGLRGRVEEGKTVEGLELFLTEAYALRGVVLDPERNPLDAVEVNVEASLGTQSSDDETSVDGVVHFWAGHGRAVSGADGRFEIPGLPRKSNTVVVFHRPYLRFREYVKPAVRELEIVLDAGGTLAGRIFGADGRGLADAQVSWGPFWGNVHPGPRRVLTDADGYFEFRGTSFGEDSPWVGAKHESHAIHIEQPIPRGDGSPPIEIQLHPALRLAGEVVDGEGTPVAGATVQIAGEREMEPGVQHGRRSTWEWRLEHDTVRTDENGSFAFGSLYPGAFEIRVFDPKATLLSTTVRWEAGIEDGRVVLDRGAMRKVVLAGTVRDAVSGEAIPEFSVAPLVNGRGQNRTCANAEGRFEIEGLEAGPIELHVKAAGYAEWRLPLAEYPVGVHDIRVDLRRSRSFLLRVMDGEGKPVRGRVSFEGRDGKARWVGSSFRSDSAELENGQVQFHGLPAEELEVVVRPRSGDAWVARKPLDLRDDFPERVLSIDVPKTVDLTFLVVAPRASGTGFSTTPMPGRRDLARLNRFLAQLEGKLMSTPYRIVVRNERGAILAKARCVPDGRILGQDIDYPSSGSGTATKGEDPFVRLRVLLGELTVQFIVEDHSPIEFTIDRAEFEGAQEAAYLVTLDDS